MQYTAKVLDIEKYVDNEKTVFEVFRTEKPFDFKPGQYSELAVDGCYDEDNLKWGYFSFASAPHQEYLEFCAKIKETPGLSSYLGQNLKEGDSINIKDPSGSFILNEEAKENIFVAIGSAIAPALSCIRHLVHSKDQKPIKLFFGFRNQNQFLYKRELEKLSLLENFSFYPISSQDDRKGHVQDVIKEREFTGMEDVYLFGNKEMISSVKSLLSSKGFSDARLH